MTKVADRRPVNKDQKAERIAKDRQRRDTSEGTAAQRLIRSASGWAGDDLEEIIEVVTETRSRSRF